MVIKCSICGSEHGPATPLPDSLQGNDCAASIYWHGGRRWFLQGHYGSTHYDGMLYLVTEPTLQIATNPVCDTCIEAWIEEGKVQFIADGIL